jgi:hypothetical protein
MRGICQVSTALLPPRLAAAHAEEELRAACTHSRACLERSEGLYPSLNPEKYVAFSTLSV